MTEAQERLAYLKGVRDSAIGEARAKFPRADEREVKVRAIIAMVREARPLEEIEFALGGLLPPVQVNMRVG